MEPGFPRISQFLHIYAAHQGGLVLWYGLGRPVITSKIGNGSVFVLFGSRLVFGIIMKWEQREPSCQMPSRLWEKIKLLLSYFRAPRKWVAPRTWADLSGDTPCIHLFTSHTAVFLFLFAFLVDASNPGGAWCTFLRMPYFSHLFFLAPCSYCYLVSEPSMYEYVLLSIVCTVVLGPAFFVFTYLVVAVRNIPFSMNGTGRSVLRVYSRYG